MKDIEVSLTVAFPGEYINDVYGGELTDEIVTEMMAEYLGEVDKYNLVYDWKEI